MKLNWPLVMECHGMLGYFGIRNGGMVMALALGLLPLCADASSRAVEAPLATTDDECRKISAENTAILSGMQKELHSCFRKNPSVLPDGIYLANCGYRIQAYIKCGPLEDRNCAFSKEMSNAQMQCYSQVAKYQASRNERQIAPNAPVVSRTDSTNQRAVSATRQAKDVLRQAFLAGSPGNRDKQPNSAPVRQPENEGQVRSAEAALKDWVMKSLPAPNPAYFEWASEGTLRTDATLLSEDLIQRLNEQRAKGALQSPESSLSVRLTADAVGNVFAISKKSLDLLNAELKRIDSQTTSGKKSQNNDAGATGFAF